jgi:hypothetical protein
VTTTNWHTYSNPYNVVIQVVKLLLVALAVYLLSLSTQLQTKFATNIVLVNATPKDQISIDRSFTVALYALRFFSDYNTLQVRASLVDAKGETPLDPQIFKKENVPFYSARFWLPRTYEPGTYKFRYDVIFDGHSSPRRPNITEDRQVTLKLPVDSVIRPAFIAPLVVHQGQKVYLPAEWDAMDVRPFSYRGQLSVGSDNNRRWIRALPNLGIGPHPVEFQSLMRIKDLDLRGRFVSTENSQTHKAGPAIYWNENTTRFYRIGKDGVATGITPGQIEVENRISAICRKEGAKYIASEIYVASAGFQAPDFTQNLIVEPNEKPRSAYDRDDPGEVSLFSDWLFLDTVRDRYYFNLNRYLIDPDGRNLDTNNLEVRVTRMKMQSNDNRFTLASPSRDTRDFRLYLTPSGYQDLMNLRVGSSILIALVVEDEVNSQKLTLRISKI